MVSSETITAAKPRGRKSKAVNQDGGHAPAQVERDADPKAAAPLQALDRVADARVAIQLLDGDELTEFATWFRSYQSQRGNE